MVAYSFKQQFAPAIVARTKRHTVRAKRSGKSRHARPGEAVQLYTAMRTKHCRKLIDVDPICSNVCSIRISVSKKHPELIDWIEIAGVRLVDVDVELFAAADGFPANGQTSRFWMGRFWLQEHGEGVFDGDVIYWKDAE